MHVLEALSLLLSAHISFTSALTQGHELPIVDLGYAIYTPTNFNSKYNLYNFTNIRYALSPTGPLRFSPPVPPTVRNTTIDDGHPPRYCPGYLDPSLIPEFAAISFDKRPFQKEYQDEDCLFLNVVVPKKVFVGKMKRKVPVVVWIHGGSYIQGNKDSLFDPRGLMERSLEGGGEGMVWVAVNYRLAALGFLAGPLFTSSGGTPNAGLHDQRLAIAWVKANIHLFGGDPSHITLMGESSGGGSIIHQITAYGGAKPIDFQAAIPQSPGFGPGLRKDILDYEFQWFMRNLGARTLEEARNASWDRIYEAQNTTLAQGAAYFPAADGSFVPFPAQLLLKNHHLNPIPVLLGHQANEGSILPPIITTPTAYDLLLRSLLPAVNNSIITHLETSLYPPIFNGSYPWTSYPSLASTTFADASFLSCAISWLPSALLPSKLLTGRENAWAYSFSIRNQSFHGGDLFSTFYPTFDTELVIKEIALMHQRYLVNFIRNWDPNLGLKVKRFEGYGKGEEGGERMLEYTLREGKPAWVTGRDPDVNERCEWWERAEYLD